MRVAINLLTENPNSPSGAQQFWQHVIEGMIPQLVDDEEIYLIVSPQCKSVYEHLFGPKIKPVMLPWSNEKRLKRIYSEHLEVAPLLETHRCTVYSTGIAPIRRLKGVGLVCHLKTMHAFVTPKQLPFFTRHYRRFMYPRTLVKANAVIINSESIRKEIQLYLEPKREKLHLVYEAVNHDLFKSRQDDEARHMKDREDLAEFGIEKPYFLFLSSLWPYKNAEGAIQAFADLQAEFPEHVLSIVGKAPDQTYLEMLQDLCVQLEIKDRVVFCGGVDHAQVPLFYRNAAVFVYPSYNETFGLTILEAMACGCPVVTSNTTAMPEIAGNAAITVDPASPRQIASAIRQAMVKEQRQQLIERGLARAADFTWEHCARQTLDVYRSVHARQGGML